MGGGAAGASTTLRAGFTGAAQPTSRRASSPRRASRHVQERRERVLRGEGLRQGRAGLQRGAAAALRRRGTTSRAAVQQGGRALPPG